MRFSIALPSLNYGRFIGACLESILAQSHKDFEVLVCDGGSVDDSVEIVRRYVAKDSRIRIVSLADEGQSDAIDRAFRVSNGEILCFLNADDVYLEKEALALASQSFARDPDLGVMSFSSEYIDVTGTRMGKVNARVHPLDRLSWIKYRGQVVQPSAFWRRDVYLSCPFNKKWHYCFDWAFFYEAHKRFKFSESAAVVAGYRLHGANKSTGVSWKRISELSEFEDVRFGEGCFRGKYLRTIAALVKYLERFPWKGNVAQRVVYLVVNTLSFASCYRLPGI